MGIHWNFLGGVEEVGASSSFVYADGTGLFIDAGLHPNKRDRNTFPHYEIIRDQPADVVVLTHSHTDHIGGLPYALKYFPHLRVMATRAARDIAGFMLRDTVKLLRSEAINQFDEEALSLYTEKTLAKINLIIEGYKYKQPFEFLGRNGLHDIKITLFPSGHILGSASVMIECGGKRILHTGDVNFRDQAMLPGADLPSGHFDALAIEATNAGEDNLPLYENEKKRLGSFINLVADKNGSVLIPAFALGKTQELLKIVYSLMQRGSIPHLPIYTAGLGSRLSKVYDKYCYQVPMKQPGFEVSDIPQLPIQRDHFYRGKYFKEPSIVIVSNGMLHRNTISYKLARRWFERSNFGIAIVGFQQEDTPGWQALQSERYKEFKFDGRKTVRKCSLEQFRFTSHARLEDSLEYIEQARPKLLFIVHGDTAASEKLAEKAMEISPASRVIIPEIGREYDIS
jgi:Cft2 family RNA processing exonuclease